MLGLVQVRLKVFAELPDLTRFFFVDMPVNSALIDEHKQLKKLEKSELISLLQTCRDRLAETDFSAETLQIELNKLLESSGQKPAVLFSLVRIATTQAVASPGLAESLAVLGKETSLRRIDNQLAAFASTQQG